MQYTQRNPTHQKYFHCTIKAVRTVHSISFPVPVPVRSQKISTVPTAFPVDIFLSSHNQLRGNVPIFISVHVAFWAQSKKMLACFLLMLHNTAHDVYEYL